MTKAILIFLAIALSGCATTAVEGKYVNGTRVPESYISYRGITPGKVEFPSGGKITVDPPAKLPESIGRTED